MAKPIAPAKPNPDQDGPRKRRGVGVLGSILLGLIALSMLGFGVTSFGAGTQRIGQVGDQNITVDQYVAALQSEVQRFSQMLGAPMPMGDLIAAGLDRQVLAGLVRSAALDGEMQAMGLSVGDAEVAAELVKVSAFTGLDGQFDRAAYAETLRQNNLTEAEFEQSLRADLARALLQRAVQGGVIAPQAAVEALFAHAGETRDISWLALAEADLAMALPAPTEAQLQAEYDSTIAAYTRPEAKRIDYVALLPEDLAKDMVITPEEVAKLYDSRRAQYIVPERRLVERLVYPNADEAAAAKAKLDAGTSFDDLVAARKLTLADVDLGDVAQDDLGAAGAAVFALTQPGVVGPLDSDLGPALFRMNGILPAQETTLDQARAELTAELQRDAARRAIGDRVDAIDDALAGGATLADLAKTEGLALQVTDYAAGAADSAPITQDAAFAKAAGDLAPGDFPQAIILDNGGVVALALREVVPPTPRPLADVKDEVTKAWRAKTLASALSSLASTKLAALQGGADMASLGKLASQRGLARDGRVEGAPPALVAAAFAATTPGQAQIVAEGDFVGILRLDAIIAADKNPEATALREAIAQGLAESLSDDVFDLYGKQIEATQGITLDQNVITSVNSQLGARP
jgi:peptidyl-prolyl cis-trans isomerase D